MQLCILSHPPNNWVWHWEHNTAAVLDSYLFDHGTINHPTFCLIHPAFSFLSPIRPFHVSLRNFSDVLIIGTPTSTNHRGLSHSLRSPLYFPKTIIILQTHPVLWQHCSSLRQPFPPIAQQPSPQWQWFSTNTHNLVTWEPCVLPLEPPNPRMLTPICTHLRFLLIHKLASLITAPKRPSLWQIESIWQDPPNPLSSPLKINSLSKNTIYFQGKLYEETSTGRFSEPLFPRPS